MTDASVPEADPKDSARGHGSRGRRRRRAGRGQLLARRRRNASRSAGKKVIVIGIDGMDPRLSRAHDERGPAAQPREAPRRRGLQHAGHQHAAAEPRRLGQLHQRGRAGRPRDLRLHPPPSRRSSAPRSTRPRRRSPAKGPGRSATTDSRSISGRSTTSCPATVLKRQGMPFWDYLDAAGVPSTFYDLPSNYPASPSHHGHHRCICGMGTPDMLGTYGTYQHFAENGPPETDRRGGAVASGLG